MRIELSDTDWVELRDPETVTNRERFHYRKRTIPALIDVIAREQNIPAAAVGAATLGTRSVEAILPDIVTAWSFDLPIPSENPDVFTDDKFPFEHYDSIIGACGPFIEALKGKVFAPGGDRTDPTTTSAD